MKLGPLLVAGVTFAALYLGLMSIAGSSPVRSLSFLAAALG